MKNYTVLLFIAVSAIFVSCKDQAKTDLFDVVYEVRFEAKWSMDTHPNAYPNNAHFSPIVVGSHNSSSFMFQLGLNASDAIQEMAETGATKALEDAIQREINLGNFLDKNVGNTFDSPGSNSVEIGVRADFSYITLVSMIAPSPDWFVSTTTNLYDVNDGLWYDVVTTEVYSFDAGTDSGTDFTSANETTNPQQPISLIIDSPLVYSGDSLVKNMGQVVFTRIQ